MIKKLTVATTNATIYTPFTLENLRQFADTCVGRPVLLGFDQYKPIGEIYSAKVIDGKLIVEAHIPNEHAWILKDMVACVGYTVNKVEINHANSEQSVCTLLDIQGTCVGIVLNADDKTLPRIK